MSLAALVNQLLPHLDPRTSDQIQRDVDDEFEFHLASIESELAAAGEPPEQARHAAVKRFGDAEKYRRQCRRIAMEDRIMLQRINAVLMVIVLLAIIGVSVQMYLTQRNNSQALAGITAQLASMKTVQSGDAVAVDSKPAPQTDDALTPASRPGAMVSLRGNVVNPGVYTLHDQDMRLTDLIWTAGGFDETALSEAGDDARIFVTVDRPVGESRTTRAFQREINSITDLAEEGEIRSLFEQIRNILDGKFSCKNVIGEKEIREYDAFSDDNALQRLRDSLYELTG